MLKFKKNGKTNCSLKIIIKIESTIHLALKERVNARGGDSQKRRQCCQNNFLRSYLTYVVDVLGKTVGQGSCPHEKPVVLVGGLGQTHHGRLARNRLPEI